MGKIKKGKKKGLKKKKKALLKELVPGNCKTSCCKKYKKGEQKRCKRCPCFDLLKKVA
ncbi:hypothetical protein [Allomuricauda sp. SCSIO 65647]|uniref:hypothetical protein n=1 Tax=Allomuricauda sp. SCSIO 65647 TaxID=2908843 RepID=UPI001F209447|nr:hypothetical protein [Muricauda sp. SCSIO 65647]UJH68719.1 hypothetical protein L0P89_05765 [Muricauda sp. SCSIO 65647]